MEDPKEPEQKRIKRIAEHIEDEIVRARHLPLEELLRHKAFMVRLLQFLSIEEAYAVSLASRRIYEWFQQNDIWYALAQRWLTPERLAQCEAWVEQVKPKGKRINYLWLLLGEYMISLTTRATIRIISPATPWSPIAIFYAQRPDFPSLWWDFDHLVTPDDSMTVRLFYEFMTKHSEARVQLSQTSQITIRSKLNNLSFYCLLLLYAMPQGVCHKLG
jgi:hypothetical protein